MPKRLFLGVSLVLSVLCGFSTLSILIGRADTKLTRLQLFGFDLCSDQPCFRGIVPGVTTWEEAKFKIGTIANHDYLVDAASGASQGNVGVYVASDGRTIGSVQQNVYDITLADILFKYGKPCAVMPRSAMDILIVILRYPQLDAFVSISPPDLTRIRTFSPVSFIMLSDTPQPCTDGIPWKGFTLVSRYEPPDESRLP